MKKTSAESLVVLASLAMACGAAQRSTVLEHPSPGSPNPCESLLGTTHALMSAVLKEIPKQYTALAGEIVRVQEVKTNVYEVRILQEERTDVVTFEAIASPECQVIVKRISERVAVKDRSSERAGVDIDE